MRPVPLPLHKTRPQGQGPSAHEERKHGTEQGKLPLLPKRHGQRRDQPRLTKPQQMSRAVLGLRETPWKQTTRLDKCGVIAAATKPLDKACLTFSIHCWRGDIHITHVGKDLTEPSEATKRHEAAGATTEENLTRLTELWGRGLNDRATARGDHTALITTDRCATAGKK